LLARVYRSGYAHFTPKRPLSQAEERSSNRASHLNPALSFSPFSVLVPELLPSPRRPQPLPTAPPPQTTATNAGDATSRRRRRRAHCLYEIWRRHHPWLTTGSGPRTTARPTARSREPPDPAPHSSPRSSTTTTGAPWPTTAVDLLPICSQHGVVQRRT
jgi:hypothetical protein